ncbi:MAG: DNA replication/repair protein RecF [Spirochaetales bacterium]|nr:DNA replication/repair protein RecF [Spirochaetales bacterium]
MGFTGVRSVNFRNLEDSRIDLSGADNIFLVGLNGQGKTNFLEMIYYLCYASSFRGKSEKDLCRHGKEGFFTGARYSFNGQQFGSLGISFKNGARTTKLDDKIIRDRKELINNIPCVVFCHDDLSFVNGSPERKRLFFDQTLSYQYPYYVDSLRKYKKILFTRNKLLKEKKRDLLEIYTVQMVTTGKEIQTRRKELTSLFNIHFSRYFRKISGLEEDLVITYQPSWRNMEEDKEIFDFLRSREDKEIFRGSSLYGPHRDNFVFMHGGKNFVDFGSTGQMRLVSLIMRIAQADFISASQEKKPILLLDDVLLELDREKRKLLLDCLPPYEQAFFTFLPGDDTYQSGQNSIFFDIEKGVLTKR